MGIERGCSGDSKKPDEILAHSKPRFPQKAKPGASKRLQAVCALSVCQYPSFPSRAILQGRISLT
jgi:hypothetical protein